MKVKKVTIIVHVIAWFVALMWILPFMGVFMASIRPYSEIIRGWWDFSSFNPTFNNFVGAWSHRDFPLSQGVLNSLIVAVPSTFIPLFVGALAGYSFARFSFPIKNYIFLTVVLLMALPQQSVAIPLFQMMMKFGLVDNFLSLILVHSAWGLPWIILFMRNFFSALPVEVEEAARVDGASYFKIFYKIVLPMSLPALASVSVLQFMWVWNDLFLALIFIYSDSMKLATQRLLYIGRTGPYHLDWSILSAASIIVMIVPVLMFVLLQKYYIKGMVGWTIKG
jgi:multiple sugar transport system permease protein